MHRGFTLLELLITVAVLTTMLLLLPQFLKGEPANEDDQFSQLITGIPYSS